MDARKRYAELIVLVEAECWTQERVALTLASEVRDAAVAECNKVAAEIKAAGGESIGWAVSQAALKCAEEIEEAIKL